MYWKRPLIIALAICAGLFVLSLALDWYSGEWPISSKFLTRDITEALALGFGVIGFQELRRGGHRKTQRLLLICMLIEFTASLVVLGIAKGYRIPALDFTRTHLRYLAGMTFAASLPAALYLNRRQNKSTLQPTADHAS